jgi:colanic acid biosynthesis glycosyl transferase WcaI
MAEWLVNAGHEVKVVTAPPYYPTWRVADGYQGMRYRKECLNDVIVWRCPIWVPSKPSGIKRILHLAVYALSSFPIMLLQAGWRPDLVMVIEPPLFCAPQAWIVSRLSGAKAWLHVQDFEVDAAFELGIVSSKILQRVLTRFEGRLLCAFDRVSTISSAMLGRLHSKGLPVDKTLQFPNWVDTQTIHPDPGAGLRMRQILSLDPAQVVVLYSGNMGEKQGLEILVDAAYRLKQRTDITFVICGEGAAKARLIQQADGLSNIKFIPLQPKETFNQFLNIADIHVLPQRFDAADLVMPSKLTGILACGGALIATSLPGTEVYHTVRQAGGLLCTPGDVERLSELITMLASDPGLRLQMGLQARQYAKDHLSKESILACFNSNLYL